MMLYGGRKVAKVGKLRGAEIKTGHLALTFCCRDCRLAQKSFGVSSASFSCRFDGPIVYE